MYIFKCHTRLTHSQSPKTYTQRCTTIKLDYNFYIFPNEEEASTTLAEINKQMGYRKGLPTANWCDIEHHPITHECLLAYGSRIEKCKSLFDGYKEITYYEALKLGWHFGFHQGRYAKLLSKFEEAEILFEELKNNHHNSFFTIQKALFLSFAYACYSMKETLSYLSSYKNRKGKIKNPKSSDEQQGWWEEKWEKEINVKGELLHYFNELHNSDKHSTSIFIHPISIYHTTRNGGVTLTFKGTQHMTADEGKRLFGSEGFFEVDNSGEFPRRKPFSDQSVLKSSYDIVKTEHKFQLINLPDIHLGKKIDSNSTMTSIELVKDYYESLIIEVITKFP